ASLRRARIGHRKLAVGADRTRRATGWGAAQRAQGIARRHIRGGQSVELGLPHLSSAHAGRPPASDGAKARWDVARRANRRAGPREVLRISRRRAKGALQSAQPYAGLRRRAGPRSTLWIGELPIRVIAGLDPAIHRLERSASQM